MTFSMQEEMSKLWLFIIQVYCNHEKKNKRSDYSRTCTNTLCSCSACVNKQLNPTLTSEAAFNKWREAQWRVTEMFICHFLKLFTIFMMTSALFELMCDFIYSHRLGRFLIIIRPVLKFMKIWVNKITWINKCYVHTCKHFKTESKCK